MSRPPLQGLKVVDATRVLAGAYCSLILADLGADVIKIEKPDTGDDARIMGSVTPEGSSVVFEAMNRNKRGVTLNLKDPADVRKLKQLCASADVFVENFRPGFLDSCGLGHEDLEAVNESLIYCSISGFGATGPYRERGGFDLVAQAMSGLLSLTGSEDQLAKVGVPICDLNAGMFAAIGVLSALHRRQSTTEGSRVEASLFESGIAAATWELASYASTGEVPNRTGTRHRFAAPYQAVEVLDGYVVVGAATDAIWRRLCEALSRPELLEEPRYSDSAARLRNVESLAVEIESAMAPLTVGEACALLESHGVPVSPVNEIPAVLDDPHVRHRGIIYDDDAGHTQVAQPLTFDGQRVFSTRGAPELGEHDSVVFGSAGPSWDTLTPGAR